MSFSRTVELGHQTKGIKLFKKERVKEIITQQKISVFLFT